MKVSDNNQEDLGGTWSVWPTEYMRYQRDNCGRRGTRLQFAHCGTMGKIGKAQWVEIGGITV